jgi:ribosome recycling factor
MTEDAKVGIRNVRGDYKRKLDHAKAEKVESEDAIKIYEAELQKAVDNAMKDIDELEKHKESEIMKV